MVSDHHDYNAGQMDISDHIKGWQGFTTFVKWSIVGILLIMVLLAIFRT
jgi:hypothetical protein